MRNPFQPIMERRRQVLGLTKTQAAQRAGVARSTWTDWEDPNEFPRMENWRVIAETLAMPLENFEQAGAINWFLQCGLSPFQIFALQEAGQPLDGALPHYEFASQDLRELDAQLEANIEMIYFPWWGKETASLRGHIRRLLIAQDAAFRAIQQMVVTFRAMYMAMVSNSLRPQGKKRKKTGKVRKKATPAKKRADS